MEYDPSFSTINEIKHQTVDLKYRLETAARACSTIAEITWDLLGLEKPLNEVQRLLLDNVNFEVRQVANKMKELDPLVELSFEAANSLDREMRK